MTATERLAMHRDAECEGETTPVQQDDIDAMLHREWRNARSLRRRDEVQRLSMRAVDKVLAEFKLLGFAGFRVREIDGDLHVEGISAAEVYTTPEFLRERGGA